MCPRKTDDGYTSWASGKLISLGVNCERVESCPDREPRVRDHRGSGSVGR